MQAILQKTGLAMQPSTISSRWSSKDLDPTKPSLRTWTAFTFTAFWFSEGFGPSTWTLGSSMVATGLTWWRAVVMICLAHTVAIIIVVLNGRAAARYHIGFPVMVRASFGMWGSMWAIVTRMCLAAIWYGVQCYFGGQFMGVFLRTMFPSFWTLPNGLGSGPGDISTRDFLSFFLYWLVSLPFVFTSASGKMRYVFWLKAATTPIMFLSIFIWALVRSHGVNAVPVGAVLQGSELYWALAAAFGSAFGNCSPFVVNQPDLSRYSRTRNSGLIQLLAMPLANTLTALFGCVVAASALVFLPQEDGTVLWAPYDLLTAILENDFSAKTRCAMWFVSLIFVINTIGLNLAANIIPFGADVAGLSPRHLSHTRGQLICACIGLCIVPWKILTTATTFLTFLSGYSIYMSPTVGIMLSDYFLVRKGNLDIASFYDGRPGAPYMYTHGFNWRAFVSWFLAVIPPTPGFVATFGVTGINVGAQRLFSLGFVVSFLTAGVIYYVLNLFFPNKAVDKSLKWEQNADELDESERYESEKGDGQSSLQQAPSSEEEAETKEDFKTGDVLARVVAA